MSNVYHRDDIPEDLQGYFVRAEIGLEPTPDEFVAQLVAVFREARRVLRDDGTLWLNLGDSYARTGGTDRNITSTGKVGNTIRTLDMLPNRKQIAPDGLKPKDLIGIPWRVAFALQQPWTDWQIKSEAMRAWTAGIVDGEGCITILRTKSSHSDSYSFPPVVQVRMTDREPLDRLVAEVGSALGAAQHPPSQVAASQRPNWQWKVVSNQAAKVISEIYPYLTCKRKQAVVAWNHQQFRASRGNQERKRGEIEREEYCKSLINDLNQRKPVDLPSWMMEPKIIQEPGWYLRQDLIWAKPNPMPESVTDRCTKAHEYLFILTKSERYFYDQDAIKEPMSMSSVERLSQPTLDQQAGSDRVPGKTNGPMKAVGKVDKQRGHGRRHDGFNARWDAMSKEQQCTGMRNKRSVWTVATQPFKGSHFATFPPDLIEPCIKAGCPAGGTVLDPFGGAGTTGMVSDRLGRNAILIELNPTYAAMAKARIDNDAPLLAQTT